jgi:hypothetical protein
MLGLEIGEVLAMARLKIFSFLIVLLFNGCKINPVFLIQFIYDLVVFGFLSF